MSTAHVFNDTTFLPTAVQEEWRPPPAPDPLSPPSLPVSGLDTPIFKRLSSLLDEWRTRVAYVAELNERVERRKAEVGQTEASYRAEVERQAQAGEVTGRDEELLAEIRAFAGELRSVWTPRIDAATELAKIAAEQYHAFARRHWRVLLGELEPLARKTTAAYNKELAKSREELGRLAAERGSVAIAVRHIISGVRPFTPAHVSDDPEALPLPSPDVIAAAEAAE